MKKKSMKLAVLIAVFALVAAACGNADESEDGGFRIAIIAPSASNDLAFTQSIVDAANLLKESGVVSEVAITDGTFVVDDAAVAIRDYASDGYDLVIAHGSQYGGSLQEIAPDFPDVSFAWGTSADTFGLPNVYSYEAASDQGGRVMGIMAAALSRSNVIGIVGPIEVGDAKLYVDGFKAGVLIQNPGADVRVNYIDSFSDVALASEAANSLIGAGADVLSGTAQMVVGAVGVAKTEGVLWFGTQANQTSLAPEIVVASQVYRWDVIFREIIENVKNGKLGGEIYSITFANEGLVIEYNDGYSLPADVRKLADDAIETFKSGG
ncbi:MAG: BMP family protein [Actinomycetota bacterium]|nr:BMP family protein [Actinomycetota bacterium]MDK1027410.1 BMP family protein [Actinomycetota bacterium]MDK1037689.1 BMP family protein [Actinomycetota bacterium]MDK1096028.1 BMP family protein [Actinomycetota bacterium]MDK1292468.1 BMP family protein [Actinomycetota bacterium]